MSNLQLNKKGIIDDEIASLKNLFRGLMDKKYKKLRYAHVFK